MLKIFTSIYDDIFCKTFSQSFFIFLCGGAAQEHIRNKIRNQLEINGLQILYPEDLFMDMLICWNTKIYWLTTPMQSVSYAKVWGLPLN